jgi:hypothetical protein
MIYGPCSESELKVMMKHGQTALEGDMVDSYVHVFFCLASLLFHEFIVRGAGHEQTAGIGI